MNERLMRIGNRHWPIVDRLMHTRGLAHEKECPDTQDAAEIVRWQKGKMERHWLESMQFRAFQVWVSYTEKDNPSMFTGKGVEGIKNPGYVEEIYPPNRAKFSVAGILNVRLDVRRTQAENAPPLSLEEIKEAGGIIDALEGRKTDPALPKKGQKRHGKTHTLTGEDKYVVYKVSYGIMFAKRRKGEPPLRNSDVIAKTKEELANDPRLNGKTIPKRTWQSWMAYVRDLKVIPGACPPAKRTHKEWEKNKPRN